MARPLPPARFEAQPHRFKLPAGSSLWRVHHSKHQPTDFSMRQADGRSGHGGRFDGTVIDPYGFYYAALDPRTALAEKFLRDVPYTDTGVRSIQRSRVRHQRSSVVETTEDLELVSLLDAEALAAVAVDDWLIHADSSDYPHTRPWASWIRRQAPWTQGLVWPSKRELGKQAIVLFHDRCPGNSLVVRTASVVYLDDEVGAAWINALLAPCRARIAPPRRCR
jgi:RES domain